MTDIPHKTLYKLNSNGSTQVWSIFIGEDRYWTVASKLNGKEIVSEPTIVKPKSTRSLKEQVISEVNSKIDKQRDKKYVDDLKDIHNATNELPGYDPMLAKKFKDQKKKINFPCIMQVKLDGIRCLATKDGMVSRGRKPIEACQHIWNELKPLFDNDPDLRLDGELYVHSFKDEFEQICSAVKKSAKKVTPKDLELQKKIQYHVYDTPRINGLTENDPFDKRYNQLTTLITSLDSDSIILVESKIVNSEEMIMTMKESFVESGYEGGMIRNIDMIYKEGRSSELLKLKDFLDSEYEIIGINEGNGKLLGHAASFVCEMKDGSTFDAKLVGAQARLKYLFEHPDEVIGLMATVRYQNMTSDNKPRFPIMKSIRGLKDRTDWV